VTVLQALKEINMDIQPGEFISVGSVGCGKARWMLMVAGSRSEGRYCGCSSSVTGFITDVALFPQGSPAVDFS
jgi:NitT/TauT family transport system ATP-binding protein